MERLTKRGKGHIDIGNEGSVTRCIQRLADYEDTGLAPEDIPTGLEFANVACALNLLEKYEALGTLEDLKALKDAEKQGLLVRLPCKVGSEAYFINLPYDCEICPALVTGVQINLFTPEHPLWIRIEYTSKLLGIHDIQGALDSMLGKTVFLTREGAEKALEEEPKWLST